MEVLYHGGLLGKALAALPKGRSDGIPGKSTRALGGVPCRGALVRLWLGFKTKLLEAICSGCFLLVKKQLYSRLPSQVQRFCLVVDVHSVQSFRDALTRCLGPFPQEDANGPLREAAYAALDKALGLTAVPKTPAQPELSSSAG